MLIKILIIFFICLIIHQFFVENWKNIEGIENEYKEYDKNDPLILAQQNAGNIEYLKQRMDKLMGLDKEVQDISGNLIGLNDQVIALVKAQADASQQLVGNTPLSVTGV